MTIDPARLNQALSSTKQTRLALPEKQKTPSVKRPRMTKEKLEQLAEQSAKWNFGMDALLHWATAKAAGESPAGFNCGRCGECLGIGNRGQRPV